MIPYKYAVVCLPRSQSFWLAQSLGFDHDPSVALVDGKWEPKSEGCVDTGVYAFPKDFQDTLIAPDAKILRLRRRQSDIIASFQKHFPNLNLLEVCKLVQTMGDRLYTFCVEKELRETVNYPIDSVSYARIRRFFYGEPEGFRIVVDRMNEPDYKASFNQLFPHIFGQP